ARGAESGRGAAILARLHLTHSPATQGVAIPRGNPIAMLFSPGYGARTVLLWIIYFANLLDIYLLIYWMPEVLHLGGLTPAQAVFAASLGGLGSVLSMLYLGPLIVRFGSDRVLALSLLSGIVFIGALALLTMSSWMTLILLVLLGDAMLV